MRSLGALSLACIVVVACGSSKKSDPDGEPTGSSKPGAAKCALPEGGDIKKSLTIPAGCALTTESIGVHDGATLTLEAGTKLSFKAGAELHVYDGKLVVKGTEKDPVLFTSAGDEAPGAWKGIQIDPGGAAGTIVDHAIVEFAGAETPISHAGLTAYEATKPDLVVTGSTFRSNGGAGLRGAFFAKVEGNTFEKNGGTSIGTSPAGLSGVKKNKADEPLHVTGEPLTASATWPAMGVPIVLDGGVAVGSESGAVLTIETGAVVQLSGGSALEMGGSGKGALVAKGVTFTSSVATPAEGDWRGLVFGGGSAGSLIDACTIEYAGAENAIGPGAGVVLYEVPELGNEVKVTGTTFRKNKFGGIRGKGCDKAEAAGNKSDGAPLCAP